MTENFSSKKSQIMLCELKAPSFEGAFFIGAIPMYAISEIFLKKKSFL
jgi:hypothetical protein